MKDVITCNGRTVTIKRYWFRGYTRFWIEGYDQPQMLLLLDKKEIRQTIEHIVNQMKPLNGEVNP